MKRIKHCCKKCHFLALDVGRASLKDFSQPWTQERRDRLEPPKNREGMPYSHWGCKKGIWREYSLPRDDEGHVKIKPFQRHVKKDRRESCFFVEYKESMTWEAAEDLQRLQYENRNLKRSFRVAIWGLYISAGAALLNFIGFKTIARWVNVVSEFFS